MNNKGGRPRKLESEKAKPSDYIECKICGQQFRRNNRTRHNNTKVHKMAENINNNIRTLLMNKTKILPEIGPVTIPQIL